MISIHDNVMFQSCIQLWGVQHVVSQWAHARTLLVNVILINGIHLSHLSPRPLLVLLQLSTIHYSCTDSELPSGMCLICRQLIFGVLLLPGDRYQLGL